MNRRSPAQRAFEQLPLLHPPVMRFPLRAILGAIGVNLIVAVLIVWSI